MTPVLQAVELQARLIRAQHDARQLRQVNAFLRARGEMCDVRMQALMAASAGLAIGALPDAARALVEAESASAASQLHQSNHGNSNNNAGSGSGSGSSSNSTSTGTSDDALLTVDALVEREMAACWLPALTARDANAVEARNANVARLIDRVANALARMTANGGANGAVSTAVPLSSSSVSSSSSFGSDAGAGDDDASSAAFEPALCAADAAALRAAFWELVGDDGVQRHRIARARQLLRRQHAQVSTEPSV
jgi:hypothetical protein